MFVVNSSTKINFIRVSPPLDGVIRGDRPRHPLVTPLSYTGQIKPSVDWRPICSAVVEAAYHLPTSLTTRPQKRHSNHSLASLVSAIDLDHTWYNTVRVIESIVYSTVETRRPSCRGIMWWCLNASSVSWLMLMMYAGVLSSLWRWMTSSVTLCSVCRGCLLLPWRRAAGRRLQG